MNDFWWRVARQNTDHGKAMKGGEVTQKCKLHLEKLRRRADGMAGDERNAAVVAISAQQH